MSSDSARPNTHTAAGLNQRSGLHTFSRQLEYHQCQKCARLFESRHDFVYDLGEWVKKIECPLCHHQDEIRLTSQQFYLRELQDG
jgi:hypothetical protein